jgi:hypothetical protein
MAREWEQIGLRTREEPGLHGWDAAAREDLATAAADLAHAISFGKAQDALESVAAGGARLTAADARALHFANEMAELRHYGPLVAVEHGQPVLAPGVRALIDGVVELGLWKDRRPWAL